MKVSNQNGYNKFLEKRGNIFRYIDEAIENWYENSPKMQGGNYIYSDKVVILVHIIVNLFRIGLRQTVGFIKGYLQQIGKNLAVISYSQASRRFKKLNIKINDCRVDKSNMENIEIIIDSTSISIYSNTPGHSKENSADRKYRSYEQVRKLHVMLSVNSKKAIAARYSNGFYSDHYGACDLLEEVNFQHKIKALYADRAYDRHKLYKLCKKYDIKTKVLPKKDAAEHSKIDYMSDRNAAINANSGLIDEVNHGRYNKLFCLVDDFCRDIEKNFAGKLLPNGKKPTRTTEIEHSEIMTIILLYQQSPCKNFKTFYLHYLTLLYKSEFPKLPSYTRFVALKPRVLWHLAMLLHWLCGQSENTGISYIDTTPIAVCHAKRISKNKVFAGIAKLSKSTYGWFLVSNYIW